METLPRPPSIGGGRSSVVESLLRTEFLPVTPAEDETPYEKVINELVATECTFVVNLRMVLEVYYWPLRNLLRGPEMMPMTPEIATAFAEFDEPILNGDELTKLYGCLEQLFPVNAGLLKDFQSAQQIPKEIKSQPNPDSLYNNIGKLFNRFVHFFKMYSMYCCAYEASAEFLGELLTAEKYAPFQRFCNIAMNLPRVGGATLASFLIQPVQRVPRYILIFRELVKYAPTSHHIVHETLRKDLQSALKEASTVAGRINEEVRARKNRDEIVALSALFWDDPQFIGPSRRLIRQGPLIRECRGGNKLFSFFLFNDTLAYAEKLVIGKYKLHRKLPIDDSFQINADLEEYKSVGYKQAVFAMEVVSLQKTFRVFFTSEAHKNEWVDDIEDQMEELKLQRARKQRPTDISSPSLATATSAVRMLPHSPDSICFGCGTTFSLLKLAVNCTLCGQIFCKKCTKTQVTLNVAKRGTTGENQDEKETIKSRSCEPCAQARLTATRERLRLKSHQSRTLGWSGLYEAMGVERKPGEGTDFGEVLSYVPRTDIEQKLSAESRVRALTDPTHSEQDAPPLEPADGTSVYDSGANAGSDLLSRRPRARIKPQMLSVFEQLELQSDQLSNLQKDRKAFTFDPSVLRAPPAIKPPPATVRKINSHGSSSSPTPPPLPSSFAASSPTVNTNSEAKTNPVHEKAFSPPPLIVSSPFQSPPPLNRSVKTPTALGKKVIPKYATIGHSPRSSKDHDSACAAAAISELTLEKPKPMTTTGANFAKLKPVGAVTPPPSKASTASTPPTPSVDSLSKSIKDNSPGVNLRSPLAAADEQKRSTCESCRAVLGDAKFCPSCGHKSNKPDLTSTPKLTSAIIGKAGLKSTDILAASRSPAASVQSPPSAIRTPSNGPARSPRATPTSPVPTIDDLLSKPVGRVRPTTEACTKCKTLRSGDKAFCNSCGQKFT